MRFKILQIDAWNDGDGWTWNESTELDTFETRGDAKRAFLRALHRLGIVCGQGMCRVVDDGDTLTLETRKTGQPLFAAILEQ